MAHAPENRNEPVDYEEKEPVSRRPPRRRRWCFTLNNYSMGDIDRLRRFAQSENCRYLVYGKEKGENNTPHLQGYVELMKPLALTGVRNKLSRQAHFEIARGTAEENTAYCTKEDPQPYMIGTPAKTPKQAGESRMHLVKEMIQSGASFEDVREEFPGTCIRYERAVRNWCRDVKEGAIRAGRETEFKESQLRDWQRKTTDRLLAQGDRKVLWIFDGEGNNGKSWLAKRLVSLNGAFYIDGGKQADIIYAYGGERIVIFDFTRSQEEQVNYSLIEKFKNGLTLNTKYESRLRVFEPCKVLALSNFFPDKQKLSNDRWDILHLNDGVLRDENFVLI